MAKDRDSGKDKIEGDDLGEPMIGDSPASKVTKPEMEVDNTVLKLRKGMGSMVRVLAKVVELRDPCKVNHHSVVANLARAIADEMNLEKNQVELLRQAASIHDMGKLYIPVEILNKPGRLTDDEYKQIKEHPVLGNDILSQSKCEESVGRIVLQHHERLNGSGYPNGISGEDIMLEARILSLADSLEAMGSKRPHRPAMKTEEIMMELNMLSGSWFDPMVVEACRKLFSRHEMEKWFIPGARLH